MAASSSAPATAALSSSAASSTRYAAQSKCSTPWRNAGVALDKRIEFRIGIHLGDVVEESDGDLMGDGVNIAARLEGIAEPGVICLPRTPIVRSRDGSISRPAISGRRNSRTLPNRSGSIRWRSGCPPWRSPRRPAPEKSAPPRLSMVVLPFANIGGDPEQEHFVDGVTESLTTDLSRISARSSSPATRPSPIKGRATDVKQIGRELNVRYVLEGSVQLGGGRMRVNVQLIDAETGNHLWADRFDKPLADLFDMQDEIVARLAGALNAELVTAEARRA